MYTVSEKCNKALKQFKRDLRFRITMENTLIEEGDIIEFNVSEGIISGENFELGGAVSTIYSAKINNLHQLYTNTNFKDKELKVEIGILLDDRSVEYVPMGIFTVDEYKENNNFIDIEALDNMIKFETNYDSKLTYPTTAKNMLQEICDICGVQLATTSFMNDNYAINKPIEKETCREVLHDLAILAGGFAKIDRNGRLRLIKITPTDLEINKDNYINLKVKEPFHIDNFVVTETYFPIDAIEFNHDVVPFISEWQGNFSLDVGDEIKLNDDKQVIQSIVTKQKIKFNGGLTYETECSGLSEQQQSTQLVNQKKINRRFSSEIKQNADEISTKVTAEEACTAVVQNADRLKISINGKLSGKTYEFDGEGFKLGSTENGDIATHTNQYSEWKFTDGSMARVDKYGFYNRIGSTQREYHHLGYTTYANTTPDSNGVFRISFTLPDEFKGKGFYADCRFRNIDIDREVIRGSERIWIVLIDYSNAIVTIEGQVMGFAIGGRSIDDTIYVTRQLYSQINYNLSIALTVTA